MNRYITGAAVLISSALLVAGCTDTPAKHDATNADQNQGQSQQQIYRTNQPVPRFDFSQYLQTLIDVETAQVHGVATTTFFFNAGVRDPYKSCPSIGFPVPSTSNITNPTQLQQGGGNYDHGYWGGSIGQQEPNGAFTGQSSGTYVVCVNKAGAKYIAYSEPNTQTEGGPAHWDLATHQIVDDGTPTVTSTQKKK